MRYDAIVLAGGSATRFGGQDKTRLELAGMTLLDRVLAAAAGAATTVVVGDPRPTVRSVCWTREQPAGGGPAAAVAAGLRLVTAPVVALLAGDLPLLTPQLLDRLVAAAGGTGVVLSDPTGREQWLTSAWPVEQLRRAELHRGGSLHRGLRPLGPVTIDGPDNASLDCDTHCDLQRARELV